MPIIKYIKTPDGTDYSFYGEPWFGTCTTTATTQRKSISITNFKSNDRTDGRRIAVYFSYAQSFNGQPTLYLGSAVAGVRYADATPAGLNAWKAGEIVNFTYYGGIWYMDKLPPLPIYDGSVT